mmetsp:Transcript_75232/g.212780  ORF Transcript_75232/g.212780 Transcript_75232/m.212780 type:complete len:238 (+) Transcript_75232:233-946(+)
MPAARWSINLGRSRKSCAAVTTRSNNSWYPCICLELVCSIWRGDVGGRGAKGTNPSGVSGADANRDVLLRCDAQGRGAKGTNPSGVSGVDANQNVLFGCDAQGRGADGTDSSGVRRADANRDVLLRCNTQPCGLHTGSRAGYPVSAKVCSVTQRGSDSELRWGRGVAPMAGAASRWQGCGSASGRRRPLPKPVRCGWPGVRGLRRTACSAQPGRCRYRRPCGGWGGLRGDHTDPGPW